MRTRRDLLKYFSIGTLVSPVAAPAMVAELIEVPKVRPVELFSEVPKPLDLAKVRNAKLVFDMGDGSSRAIDLGACGFDHGNGIVQPMDRVSVRLTIAHADAAQSPMIYRYDIPGLGFVMEMEGTLA